MSHKAPIPEASVSPFPAHPAPIAAMANVEEADAASDNAPVSGVSGRTIGIAAGAAAIGSAAIAAALLFYNRAGGTSPKEGPARKTQSKARKAAGK